MLPSIPNLRLEQPAWFWLAAAAIPLGVLGWWWMRAMGAGRRAWAVVLRAALLAVIAAALAGLSAVKRTEVLAVVGVVDVSESVRRLAPRAGPAGMAEADPIERARGFLARATKSRGPDDLLGLVVFDGKSLAVATPTRGDALARPLDVRLADGTNIAQAILLARSLIPPDANGRVVLIGDGVETAGSLADAARELAGTRRSRGQARAIPIDAAPVTYDIPREVLVESVDAPPTAAAESTVRVRVVLNATAPSTGSLRLLREGQPVRLGEGPDPFARRVTLAPGRHVESLDITLDAGRLHRFRAVYEPDVVDDAGTLFGDTLVENNTGEAFTVTPGRGSVLIADGVSRAAPGGPGSHLAEALRAASIDTVVVAPESMPTDLLSLQSYDVVVLQNVPAEALSTEAQEQLVAYVKDLGGGLVMVGGPDSFGGGGWRSTPIEPILPVRLDLPDRVVAPETATIFVIDNSGSMAWNAVGTGTSKQAIANEATALAITRLERHDLVGVTVFNNEVDVVIPLSPNTNPAESARIARDIPSRGGTFMGPALEEARAQMVGARAIKHRHVIVLSDGRSRGRETLVDQSRRLAGEGVMVSTIAVGDDADVERMDEMARAGGGTFYRVLNASLLPRVFLKAVRVIKAPMIREEPFTPIVRAVGSPALAGLSSLPTLHGLSLTQPRTEPTVATSIITPQGEPVLASWNVELGRVAAFTSDAHEWAREWRAWPGYRTFWSQLTRSVAKPAASRALQGRASIATDRMRLAVDARGDDGRPLDGLAMAGTVYAPSGASRPITLAQVGPGLYEGEAPVLEGGTHVAIIRPQEGEARLTPVILGAMTPQSPELRTLRSNEGLLEQAAAITGGRLLSLDDPSPPSLFDRAGLRPFEAVSLLTRALLIWAVVLLLLDIGNRRVAWDRFLGREFGGVERALAGAGAKAERAVGGLRERRRAAPAADPLPTLGEQDARNLAAAARDRRRAAKVAEIREYQRDREAAAPDQAAPPGERSDAAPAEGAGGLLAAKRRAAARYVEGDGPGAAR